MYFLDDSRPKEENDRLMIITQSVVVSSAINEGLIGDGNLPMIPEVMAPLMELASTSRDDLFRYFREQKKKIQFPIIQKFFCYNFAKGVESAYLWNESNVGNISFSYNMNDAIDCLVGAHVSQDFQNLINIGIIGMGNIFCDFQNKVILNKEYNFVKGGTWLQDGIACGFMWASSVGVKYGTSKLGLEL